MTPRQCIAALVRRWYVVLAVLLMVVGGIALVPRDAGVYWSRATVVFVPPINPTRAGNVLEGSDPSLIYFAAAVERIVNGGQIPARLSGDAGLYGVGIRDGWSVVLQNSGGQWQTNFNRPMLTVEVVAPDAATAEARMTTLLDSIESIAKELQVDDGTSPTNMITVEVSPSPPSLTFIGGNWKRAVAGILALGAIAAVASALLVDRWANRRRSRRGPANSDRHVDTVSTTL